MVRSTVQYSTVAYSTPVADRNDYDCEDSSPCGNIRLKFESVEYFFSYDLNPFSPVHYTILYCSSILQYYLLCDKVGTIHYGTV